MPQLGLGTEIGRGTGGVTDPDALAYFTTAGIGADAVTPTAYGTTNLIPYSQQIDNLFGWSGVGASATSGQTDPLGGSTATLLNVSVAGANNWVTATDLVVSPSTAYTFSFYAKQGTQTGNNYAVYDFGNFVFTVSPTSYASRLNTSTYTRVSVTFTTSATQTKARVYFSSNSTSTGNWYVWGPQLETGSVATTYVPTTTSSNTQVLSTAPSRTLINSFVRGVKNLGLWNSMVCWPMRSTQNASTTLTAYSLGGFGTYNGSLTGSASNYSSLGLNTYASNYITTSLTGAISAAARTIIACYSSNNVTGYFMGYGTSATNSAFGLKYAGASSFTTDVYNGSVGVAGSVNANYHVHGGTYNGTQVTTTIDAVTPVSSTIALTTGSSTLDIGTSTPLSGQPSTATLASAFYFNTSLTNSQFLSLRSLIQTTIGSGLTFN